LLAVSAGLWLSADDASAQWWEQPALLSPEPWSETTVSDDTIELVGYGYFGNTVYATVDGADGYLTVQTTIDYYGDWSMDVPLATGENEITVYLYGKGMMPYDILWVTREDNRGGERIPILLSPAPGSQASTSDPHMAVSGIGEPGDSVLITVEHADFDIPAPAAEAIVGPDLKWSTHIPLGGGENLVRVYTDGYDPDTDGTDRFSPHETFSAYRDRGSQVLDVIEVAKSSWYSGPSAYFTMNVDDSSGRAVEDISVKVQYAQFEEGDYSDYRTYLIAPDGTEVDIPLVQSKTFTTTNTPALQELIGHDASGDWRFAMDGTPKKQQYINAWLRLGVDSEYRTDEHRKPFSYTSLGKNVIKSFSIDVPAGAGPVVDIVSSISTFGDIEDDDLRMWLKAPDGSMVSFKHFGDGADLKEQDLWYYAHNTTLGQMLGKDAVGIWTLYAENRWNGGNIFPYLKITTGFEVPDHARDTVSVRGYVDSKGTAPDEPTIIKFNVTEAGMAEAVALKFKGTNDETGVSDAFIQFRSPTNALALCTIQMNGIPYTITDCPEFEKHAEIQIQGTWTVNVFGSYSSATVTVSDAVLEITTTEPAPPPFTTTTPVAAAADDNEDDAAAWPVTVQPAPPQKALPYTVAHDGLPEETPGASHDRGGQAEQADPRI